jgi:hypothetical protein
LATCQFVPPPTAVLTVDGPEVRLNGAPASTGDPVNPGDHVSTGAASAARIGWSLRRYMLVDENSDPLYRWSGPDGRTLQINIGVGWFLIDTISWDVRVDNDIVTVALGSRAVFHVVPAQYVDVYLLEGTATVVRPQGPTLAPGEKVRIEADGTLTPGIITPAEQLELQQRFMRWTLPARIPQQPNRNDDRSPGSPTPGGGGYEPPSEPESPR